MSYVGATMIDACRSGTCTADSGIESTVETSSREQGGASCHARTGQMIP
jgi:hypothetical protein